MQCVLSSRPVGNADMVTRYEELRRHALTPKSWVQHRTRRKPEGGVCIMRVPRGEWEVSIPDAHVGYISWEEYETNQRRLRESAQAQGLERRKSPPREGPALLQGIVLCGVCGRRMTVRYHVREHQLKPNYMCQQEGIKNGEQFCQSILGRRH